MVKSIFPLSVSQVQIITWPPTHCGELVKFLPTLYFNSLIIQMWIIIIAFSVQCYCKDQMGLHFTYSKLSVGLAIIINNILCDSISKVHKYLSEICGFYQHLDIKKLCPITLLNGMPAATISCSKHMGTAFLVIVPREIETILLQSQCNCLDNYTGTLQGGAEGGGSH